MFRRCLEQVAADAGGDAIPALTVPVAVADPAPSASSAAVSKPPVLSVLNQAEVIPAAAGRARGRWFGSAALIRSIHAAPLLLGHRGTPAADLAALQYVLLRLCRLADDLPQVAELDLNPVIARADGAHVVDTRVRRLR